MTRKRLWMNRISGIVCLLLWIALVIFLSGTTGKIAGMALGIMLLVAVIYNLYLPKEVSTHLIIPAYAQKEEKITGRLCISNTGVFPVLSGKVFLQVKKTISGEQEIFSMNIRAAGRKNGAAAFVIDSEYMGFLEITILRVELYSFFGCMKKVTYVNQEKVVMILPQTTELHFPVQNSGAACSFFDEEQSGKKGNGPGEYFGIRPYVDGDSMKLIHWKLTGKTDEYMVKEVEVPMMRMPLIFLETRVEKLDAAMIDGLLEAFFSISQHMAQEGQKHCLCWWDKKTDGWNFYNVANAMQLEEVYAHVFQSMFFSQGNATIDSFEKEAFMKQAAESLVVHEQKKKERKEQFSEVIYITEYWNEKQAVFDDWNLTLLLERREARKEEGEALVPYIFSAETMGEDIDRILTAYRSVDYGA